MGGRGTLGGGRLTSHDMCGWNTGLSNYAWLAGWWCTIPLPFERDTSTVSRPVFPELLYLVGVFIMSHPLEKICLVGPKNPRIVQFLPKNSWQLWIGWSFRNHGFAEIQLGFSRWSPFIGKMMVVYTLGMEGPLIINLIYWGYFIGYSCGIYPLYSGYIVGISLFKGAPKGWWKNSGSGSPIPTLPAFSLWRLKQVLSLRIQICPEKGITPIFLFWGWDWDHQSYSREGSGSLGF